MDHSGQYITITDNCFRGGGQPAPLLYPDLPLQLRKDVFLLATFQNAVIHNLQLL
jgi:hypothetical protein